MKYALIFFLSVLSLPAQFTPPTADRQAVTTDGSGGLVSPTNFFTENASEISALSLVQSVAGKSGVVTLDKSDVGLVHVENTADMDKPVSNATRALLAESIPASASVLAVTKRLADMRIDEIGAGSPNGFTQNRLDVTGITAVNPPVVTTGAYGTSDFQNGDWVSFESISGMTQINGLFGQIQNKSSASDTTWEVAGIDASGFSSFANGGTVTRLGSKRLLIYNTGDSFAEGKAGQMLGLGFSKAFSRRSYQINGNRGPSGRSDGAMIAHYMDYDYGAGVTHYVKNNGGSNGRIATPDYTISLSGSYWEVTDASEPLDFYGLGDTLVDATKIEVFYVTDSGLGDFKIQTSTNSITSGYTDLLTGITTDSAKSMSKAEIRLDSVSDVAVRIVATSGTVKILGCLIYRDDRPEVILVNAGVSSLSPELSYGALDDSIGEAILTELHPDLITFAFADANPTQPDALDDIAGWQASATIPDTRQTSVIVFGITPTTLTSASVVAAATKEKCEEHGFAYFDGWQALGESDANLYKYGITRDGAHLSEEGSLIIAHLAATHYGWPSPLTASSELESMSAGGLDLIKTVRRDGKSSWVTETGSEIMRVSGNGTVGGNGFHSAVKTLSPQYKFPGGFKMSGSSSYIDLGDIFNQDMTTDWSIDFWLFTKRPVSTGFIFSSRLGTPTMEFNFSNIGAATLNINDGTNGASIVLPSGTISTNRTLRHIAVVCDVSESDGLRLYLDGSLVGSADPTSVGDLTHVNEMVFGARRNDGKTAIHAMFASINLWSKALSETDVVEIRLNGPGYHVYKNGGAIAAGLYSGYRMTDFGSGTQILDWSGNERDGTVSGATLY